jgi:hypothetical protein
MARLQLLFMPSSCLACLVQAVAMLGPGSWFGGGSTIYGSGQLLLALRLVARGGLAQPALTSEDPDCMCTLVPPAHCAWAT